MWMSSYQAGEPVGADALAQFAEAAYDGADPLATPTGEGPLTITRADGGVPFCLPSALDYPRNPIWQPADESSSIQTAANAAALSRRARKIAGNARRQRRTATTRGSGLFSP